MPGGRDCEDLDVSRPTAIVVGCCRLWCDFLFLGFPYKRCMARQVMAATKHHALMDTVHILFLLILSEPLQHGAQLLPDQLQALISLMISLQSLVIALPVVLHDLAC